MLAGHRNSPLWSKNPETFQRGRWVACGTATVPENSPSLCVCSEALQGPGWQRLEILPWDLWSSAVTFWKESDILHPPCPHRQTGDNGYVPQRAFGGCDSQRQTREHLGAPSWHTSEGHNPSGGRGVSTFLSWSEASRTLCATLLCFLPSEGDVYVITPTQWAQNGCIQGTGSQLVAARSKQVRGSDR